MTREKKKKGGLRSALYGVLVGLGLGLLVLILKSYISSELVALLNDEASQACDCSFQVDSLNISLISLQATAKGAQILREGKPGLRFERVKAQFSLENIWDKKVDLLNLSLIDGKLTGVLPGSTTFDFVDHLAAPSANSDGNKKIKIRLQRLTVIGTSFSEEFETGTLLASGVGMDMARTASDDFELRPQIGTLEFELSKEPDSKSNPKRLQLGNLRSSLLITDDIISFKKILMRLKQASATASAEVVNDSQLDLSGELEFGIDARSLDFPEWMTCTLEGSGKMEGALDDPTFRGSFQHRDVETPVKVAFDPVEILALDEVQGNYELSVHASGTEFLLTDIAGTGNGYALSQTRPFEYRSGSLTGGLRIQASEILLGDAKAENVVANIQFNGPLGSLKTSISGLANSLILGNNQVKDIRFGIENQDDILSFQIERKEKDQNGSFQASGEIDLSAQELHFSPTTFEMEGLKLFPITQSDEDSSGEAFIELSGKGEVEGPVALSKIAGKANLKIASPQFSGEAALRGEAFIEDGALRTEVKNQSGSIQAALNVDFAKEAEDPWLLS